KRNFLKAIVIGEKKELDESIKNLFIETGTSHLLAISGLHVSFILSFLTSLVPLRRILSRIIFFPILLFYGWILGENPPVWRVIGQYAFVTMAFLLRKEEDSLNAIFWVALINLIISPLKLFNVSFQLSYMAMLGLLYKPNFSKFLPNYLQEIWESSFWLFIFLLPLNLYYFGKIPFISILSNFFAIPVFSIILFLTFIFIGLSLFSVGNFLGSILSLLISILFSGLHLLLYHYKISLLISLFLIILPIFSRKREV
ncbi:MAG: ComEC/Rec2 family competence protein, partial [Dictyoglomus sp.]